MKVSTLLVPALAAVVSSHAIFQKVSVNGADQGQLKGVRAPDSDYPIQDVNDGSFACNKGIVHKDNTVISIPAGARVGAWWGHIIGGPAGSNDPDNPIASSHKGPIMYYLAKVSDAASTGTTGLSWFKVGQEGLSNGRWAVDNMISNGGWHYFTMPSCIAPGDYLLRVELLALHSAFTVGQAQFYMECAQIRVTGSGNYNGGSTVRFPGAYNAQDPGILLSIYDNSGHPNNGGRPYTIPGPAVMTCGGGSGGGSNPTTTRAGATTTAASGGGGGGGGGSGSPLYGQCGGNGWTGSKSCASGTCKYSNDYYSQCLP